MEDVLLYFALKYRGQFDLIYNALKNHDSVDQSEFDQLKKQLHASYTTIISDDYPERLKQINCPPFVLFYYGNLKLADSRCTGVIGMRHPSFYGIDVTQKIVEKLVFKGITIVSGMAIGIDGIAHRSALNSNGKTIAVLGGGIDYIYPKSNRDIYQELKDNHLIVSEYPFDDCPTKDGFPKRNRIIAGLGDELIVTEAMLRSGTMITVGFALEQGKDVYAVPSRIDDAQGCNCLIDQGARMIYDIDEFVEDLVVN